MKNTKLVMLNFMALCCVFGLFIKKIVNPFANIITEFLHIPGGISTGFSIMFLVVGKELVQLKFAGTLMGCVQGFLALVLGRVGSMGVLAPIGYILPGIVLDLVSAFTKGVGMSRKERMILANMLAAVMASLTANTLVFHLSGLILWLYLSVSATSGALYGSLGAVIMRRLDSITQLM